MRKSAGLLITGIVLGATFFWVKHEWISASATSRLPAGREPASATSGPQVPKHCQSFYQTVCKPKSKFNDPTGVVHPDYEGENSALKIFETIHRQHPHWTMEQKDDELVKKIYTPKATQRIKSAYKWAQSEILKWIDSYPENVLSAKNKARLAEQIRTTHLQLPPPANVYDDERELFTKNDVFYEHEQEGEKHSRRMRVGGAFILNVKSWFNLIFTIAHEFGHAIDPCELRGAKIDVPAYRGLTQCFLRQKLIASSMERKECVKNDQLSESFADWLAVKVTLKALKEYSTEFHGEALLNSALNAVKDLCEIDDETPANTEFHPSPKVRIESIFGSNPGIRVLLGCPATPEKDQQYCELEPLEPTLGETP